MGGEKNPRIFPVFLKKKSYIFLEAVRNPLVPQFATWTVPKRPSQILFLSLSHTEEEEPTLISFPAIQKPKERGDRKKADMKIFPVAAAASTKE